MRVDIFWSARALFDASQDCDVLAIDIPIGLSDSGPRDCDTAARRMLGPLRATSVFPAPVRAALEARSWEEACALSEAACGRRLSRQTFAILARIREVDAAIRSGVVLPRRVREVHPEVCFAVLNGGRAVEEPKRSANGYRVRRRLLEEAFGPVFDSLRGEVPRAAAADDDFLDALVALWTAERILGGVALTLPETPPQDVHGLSMEMVA